MENEAQKQINEAERNYPGAAVDAANDNKVSREMVDEETCELNNNPRNNDL